MLVTISTVLFAQSGLNSATSLIDEAVITTGSRIESDLGVRLDQPDIEKLSPIFLDDVINRLPGVRAVTTGGAAGGDFISIRGGEPNYSLILIDGINVTNPSNSRGGGFDISQIDVSAVDSLELIPTGRSAIHGSDALSGIINLNLKQARDEGLNLSLISHLDTQSAFGTSGFLSNGSERGDLVLGGGYFDSGDLTEGSDISRFYGLGRFKYEIQNVELSGLALYSESDRDRFPEASGGPELSVIRDLERSDGQLFVLGGHLNYSGHKMIKPHLSISYASEETDLSAPAIVPGIIGGVPAMTSITEFDRFDVTGDIKYIFNPDIELLFGSSYSREQAMSVGELDFGFPLPTEFDIHRDDISVFAEGKWVPNAALSLIAAARRDWLDNGEAETTAQLYLSYRVPDTNFSLDTTLAEGFRRPSLFALAFPLTSNPDLLPERSRTFDLGLRWQITEHDYIRVSGYHNSFKNQVDFEPSLFTHVNRDRVETSGFELEASWGLSDAVNLSGNITYIDINANVILRQRPNWQGSGWLNWQVTDRVSLGLAARFNTDFYDTSVPTGLIRLGGHAGFDSNLNYKFSTKSSIQIALRNLTNKEHETSVGFPAPPRHVRFTLRQNF